MEAWEYTYIQASTNDVERMIEQANLYGALGWEAIGITTADRTVGLNTNVVIMKRRIETPAPPSSDDEWQADPTGRYEKRRWDAAERRWTAQTATVSSKSLHTDPPRVVP